MARRKSTPPVPIVPAAVPANEEHDAIVAAAVTLPVILGVYCLVRGDVVVYVGQSKDVLRRLYEHRRQSKFEQLGRKQFDRIAVFPCKDALETDRLESRLIAKLQPEYNLQGVENAGAKPRQWWKGLPSAEEIAAQLNAADAGSN